MQQELVAWPKNKYIVSNDHHSRKELLMLLGIVRLRSK